VKQEEDEMGTMLGLVIGYVLGTRAGEKGYDELRDAWKTIRTSEEVKDMVVGGLAVGRSLLQRGSSMLAERLQPDDTSGLKTVA
jgi:hypothetical protein